MKVRRKSDNYVIGGWAAEYKGHAKEDGVKKVLHSDLDGMFQRCVLLLWCLSVLFVAVSLGGQAPFVDLLQAGIIDRWAQRLSLGRRVGRRWSMNHLQSNRSDACDHTTSA